MPDIVAGEIKNVGPEILWMPASGNSQLACRVWRGKPTEPVIVYLHGIEGHSQWFEPTANVLHGREMTVYAPDRRGSGLHTHKRGDLASLNTFIVDVETLLRKIERLHPLQPIVLFANCWSAKAAAVIARRNHVYADKKTPVKLHGLVLTCPAIITKADFNFFHKLQIALCTFAGDRFNQSAWPVPLATEMLTDNPVYLEYLHSDPLRLKMATARFFRETFILGLLAQQAPSELHLPLLVLQAADDQIVDIAKLKSWFDRVHSSDKQWQPFANATHSLDFDARWFTEYTNLLCDWLLARTAKVAL